MSFHATNQISVREMMISGLELLLGPEEQKIRIVDGKLSARPTYLATTSLHGSRLPLLRLREDAESLDFPGEFTSPLQTLGAEQYVWVGKNQCILLTKTRWNKGVLEYDREKCAALDAVLCWIGFEDDILKRHFTPE